MDENANKEIFYEDKNLWNFSTFNPWWKYYSSNVVTVKDDTYQSEYVFQYNILKEAGWEYTKKHWVSPHDGGKFNNIYNAYGAQRLWEIINNKTDE